MEWIDVNERLPKVYDEVLITDGKYISIGYVVSVDDRKYVLNGEVGNLREWIGRYPVNNVTHWMPLPEPPKNDFKE